MPIIDKRSNKSTKAASNRNKFIERYKKTLKKQVDKLADGRSIKNVANSGEVTIDGDTIKEPWFHYDSESGRRKTVLPGNEEFTKGDKIRKPQKGGAGRSGGGGNNEDSEDDFTFTLTKEEFLDIYFHGMALPRFIKEGLLGSDKMKLRRAGYVREGIPSRLNLKKSFENAIARKIIAKSRGKKCAFLDDTDLRYNHFTQHPVPVCKAVMFCLMDVSASMGEWEKTVAKKFFLLLYLFLHKSYDKVDIRFIQHTTTAKEVNEHDFFYNRWSGGTAMSSSYVLTHKIIQEEYASKNYNIYIAQASDGDNFQEDVEPSIHHIRKLLDLTQYFAYIEISDIDRFNGDYEYFSHHKDHGMYSIYEQRLADIKTFAAAHVTNEKDVFPVLQKLFKEDQ